MPAQLQVGWGRVLSLQSTTDCRPGYLYCSLVPMYASSCNTCRKRLASTALQARLGQQLWPREQPSLAHPMVPSAAAVALFVQTGAQDATAVQLKNNCLALPCPD